MIHLCRTPEFKSLCRTPIKGGDVLTYESPPHNRLPKNLCLECKKLYDGIIDIEGREARIRYENWKKNRTFKERLVEWANFAEGSRPDFYLIPVLATFGLPLLIKRIAKLILKVFYE
jgi:hypothetical protein